MTFVSGVYVPIGGKQLLTFLDDFNMPAKDTFGSQPPLELIRQWVDYGFWYDRMKQTVKHVKVRYAKTVCLHPPYLNYLQPYKVMSLLIRFWAGVAREKQKYNTAIFFTT